ncbi:MAG: hypothetical protein P9L95_06430 [Candidatus Tenebribacter mawsonii]|nr:hypothetical protein [Candidatus Tenebribacter mawsonii]
MKIKLVLLTTFLTLLFLGCENKENYIIPVDFEKYEKDYIPGLTQKGSQDIQSRQWEEVSENTIGKELPDLIIVDQTNHEIELRSLINEKTLVVLTGAHCGWGMEGLTNDLPHALKKLQEDKIEIEVICLFIKADSDDEDIELFNTKFDELKSFYPNIYVITEKESKRLNVFANPTRMLINKDKSVCSIGLGVSTPERLFEELKKQLPTNAQK